MRKVINKMVTEEDLIATVAAAYSHGWRQVKLYFMCGLPTETDEDVLAIGDLAKRVIATGREVSGRRDIRCTVSIGGFVPKPHTPFQWAAQRRCGDHRRPAGQAAGLRYAVIGSTARRSDFAITTASQASSRACCPAAIGASARSSRRSGGTVVDSTAGGEHFSYQRWAPCAEQALDGTGVDLDWYTTREREYAEVLPWDHLDAGLDRDWLWEDWQDALDEVEVEDCRWTPCFDCGVCPQLDTSIQIGPTGRSLLPLTPLSAERESDDADVDLEGGARAAVGVLSGESRLDAAEPDAHLVAERAVVAGRLADRGHHRSLNVRDRR